MPDTFNDLLVQLRDLTRATPTAEATEAICAHLDAWPPDADPKLGVRYALEHMAAWPEPLRLIPRATWTRLVAPHVAEGDPLRATLRHPTTDGLKRSDDPLPFADHYATCDACDRRYPSRTHRPDLWVGWSGASVTCVHCFFGMHYELYKEGDPDTIEFLADYPHEGGESMGGVAGYVAQCGPEHDRDACGGGWCFLCDPEPLATA